MADTAVHRVVIVGGGFGGLFAAKFLRRAPVEVTLVDARNYHLFQPLLYQLATGILSEGEVAPPIRDILRRHAQRHRRDGHGPGLRPGRPDRDRTPTRRHGPHLRVRQPGRRRRSRAVVLRPRRVLPVRAGHEDDRRRPRAAGPDLRCLRDGGERAGPGGASRLAHLRGGRWGPDRGRDRRPDRRAGAHGPRRATSAGSTPPRPRSCSSTAARRSSRRSATGSRRRRPPSCAGSG